MRADNGGEGGILALVALVRSKGKAGRPALVMLGLFGAALLYGDGMITPAISVLSAVEGLGVATNVFEPFVVPITVVILIVLFLVQRRGTGGIGAVFGPIMIVWFVTLILLGIPHIIENPVVLDVGQPAATRFAFLRDHGWASFLTLGAVFLSVTGAEALYADMGHFGRHPIRIAWFSLVLPALVVNYMGQGALLLSNPDAREHPFFYLAPGWALLPLVVLSTMATVIASQAVISGAFSLTQQAIQLGYSPRFNIHAHLGARKRPGLHSRSQLAADGGDGRPGVRLQDLDEPGGGLRHGGDDDDGHHDDPGVFRRARALGLERAAGDAGLGRVPRHRSRVLRRERHQDRARRLVPAGWSPG